MIFIILKKTAEIAPFVTLLKQSNYVFKQFGLGRIFSVESTLEDFQYKNNEAIRYIDNEKFTSIEPSSTIHIEDNVSAQPPRTPLVNQDPNSYMPHTNSWARHRVIRRNSPFKRNEFGQVGETLDGLKFTQTRTGRGVDVYVIDQGLGPTHEEISGIVTPIPEVGMNVDDMLGYHGLPVIACFIGKTVGASPDAKAWYQTIIYSEGTVGDNKWVTEFDNVLQHYLSRASTNRPAVLNLSWGRPGGIEASEPQKAIVADMIDSGIIMFMPVGNTTDNTELIDANPAEIDPDIVRVGGTNAQDGLYWLMGGGSATGADIQLYAPAQSISLPLMGTLGLQVSLSETDGYRPLSGTSFGSPTAGAVAACMLEGYQRMTSRAEVQALTRKMISNSTKGKINEHGRSIFSSNGLINNRGGVVNDRIVYLNPFVAFENIEGLNPK